MWAVGFIFLNKDLEDYLCVDPLSNQVQSFVAIHKKTKKRYAPQIKKSTQFQIKTKDTKMENTSANKIKLGTRTLISDPCYDKDTWCAGEVNTLPGEYIVQEIVEKGKYPILKGVFVVHYSQYGKLDFDDCYEDSGIDVGVDSGECGIYDSEKYPVNGIDCDDSKFEEDRVVYRTPDGDWGVTAGNFGGDGSYKAYLHRNRDGLVDAIYINFAVCDYDEDEEYDEDYYE